MSEAVQNKPIIEARDLRFAFRPGHPVIAEVSFTVPAGEFFGIIGPNGSGKTTLLRLLSRGLLPHEGQVMLGGRPLQSYSFRELGQWMALVPQESSVAFPFTVLEIVLMGRSPYLKSFSFESRADLAFVHEALVMTGIADFALRRFHDLSGGEKQRVIIARSLAQQPRIMLLDEPTAFLDLKHQVGILELMRELVQKKGLTVIAVSHDLNLAGMFCDRMMLLDHGRIAGLGSTKEVLRAEIISRVYDTPVKIEPRGDGRPLVLPVVRNPMEEK